MGQTLNGNFEVEKVIKSNIFEGCCILRLASTEWPFGTIKVIQATILEDCCILRLASTEWPFGTIKAIQATILEDCCILRLASTDWPFGTIKAIQATIFEDCCILRLASTEWPFGTLKAIQSTIHEVFCIFKISQHWVAIWNIKGHPVHYPRGFVSFSRLASTEWPFRTLKAIQANILKVFCIFKISQHWVAIWNIKGHSGHYPWGFLHFKIDLHWVAIMWHWSSLSDHCPRGFCLLGLTRNRRSLATLKATLATILKVFDTDQPMLDGPLWIRLR
jgi:hypothetical protein